MSDDRLAKGETIISEQLLSTSAEITRFSSLSEA